MRAPNRRQILQGLAATGAGLGLPPLARARPDSGVELRFLFIQTLGGWDPTRVFASCAGSSVIETEADAVETTQGNISYVSHANRPSVDQFFLNWGSQTAILNGVYVPSISHHSATRITLTSEIKALHGDWPTRISAYSGTDPIVPHLVTGGACFSGPYGVHVGRVGGNGQLPDLASGDLRALNDAGISPSETGASAVEAWLKSSAAGRAASMSNADRKAAIESWLIAAERAERLQGLVGDVELSVESKFSSQAELAVLALGMGLSRCVTTAYPLADSNVEWDTHANNSADQSALYEGLFGALDELMTLLSTTAGTQAATLLDETVIVLLSEMGRTPFVNGSAGKDHWPYTSAMLIGPAIRGDQVIGAFDDDLYGKKVDLVSGEVTDSGSAIGTDVIGATLLTLAGIDPAEESLAASPLEAVIA